VVPPPRFKCDECGCNERHPKFKYDDKSPRRMEVQPNGYPVMVIIAVCIHKSCNHSTASHRYTFEKPEKEK